MQSMPHSSNQSDNWRTFPLQKKADPIARGYVIRLTLSRQSLLFSSCLFLPVRVMRVAVVFADARSSQWTNKRENKVVSCVSVTWLC